MATVLTADEKLVIAEQHLKTVLYSEYNVSFSLIEANAAATPNTSNLESLNSQATDIAAQKAALMSEINSLKAEIAAATPSA